ncbi:MAG: prepilin peptidase [Myxococcales bacterium]|jgi:leader peptidase (prepilin peptidase)/N-methyltransferase|nr:prepilin peptidase [Myxococcales bacterium]
MAMIELSAVQHLPLPFWAVTTFLIAACVGSFLNVVIARVPRERSIVWPGSHCFTCGAPVQARHNIPILSWFLLRGRCHDCQAPFSVRYALVELAFALLCVLAIVRHGGPTHAALQECALLGFLIPLACIDLDTWLLPHAVTIPGVIVGLLFGLSLSLDDFLNRLIAAAIGYTVLLVGAFIGERLLGKEVMGGGDFVLFALIGAFLGTRALLPVIFLASSQGAAVGIALIAKRGAWRSSTTEEEEEEEQDVDESDEPIELESEVSAASVAVPLTVSAKLPDDGWVPDAHAIPFGPFLALGAIEVAYFSEIPALMFPWIS